MKVVIYTQNDGLMSVLFPCYEENMNESQQNELLQQAISLSIPKKLDGSDRNFFIKDISEIVPTQYLTAAWLINEEDGSIFFDRPRAIELKKKEFRLRRKPILEKLDIDFMKALEIADSTAISEIVAKKQVLRDITNIDMSHCDTPEKLYNYIPEELKTV